MGNVMVIALLALLLGGIVWYLVREKKRGVRCVGCPHSKSCSGCCGQNKKDPDIETAGTR